jgi:hypothetical protein
MYVNEGGLDEGKKKETIYLSTVAGTHVYTHIIGQYEPI